MSKCVFQPSHQHLPYTGDVSPADAWKYMLENEAVLVDVRTSQEWQQTGLPDTDGTKAKLYTLSLMLSPDYSVNQQFAAMLEQQITDKTIPLFFLCKIGGRSAKAAILASGLGYRFCYNILGGFEGDENAEGMRGTINGWKAEGLPWIQG